ncbi:hypothetical protein, partial [Mycobacterium avium]|uniref:hypothetical protein n=1 Tax=Mycobacterium avium TaxID=1764 RepID=UPI003AFB21F3
MATSGGLEAAGAIWVCGAAGGDQQDLVAHVQVGHRVGDHQYHPPGVGELAQHQHHLTVQRRVQ